MDIGNTHGVGGPGRVDGPNRITRIKMSPAAAANAAAKTDQVSLTAKAGMVSKAMSLPATRAERMAEVKKLIETGKFETDVRLEGALQKFFIENSDL
jgi:hypothetical protein